MTFTPDLTNYGIAGIFISYLVYDRQVLLKQITKALEELTIAINNLKGGITK